MKSTFTGFTVHVYTTTRNDAFMVLTELIIEKHCPI